LLDLRDDEIDFAHYMQATDAEHRVRCASLYADDVIEYFHGSKTDTNPGMPWQKTHDLIRFRPHEVTVWGGYNGHGKSLVLGQIVNHFAVLGLKSCIASLEMRPQTTLQRMCRQSSGQIPSKEFIEQYHQGLKGFVWMYDQQGTVKGQKILAVIRYAVEKYGVQHFVIDSLMKCGFGEEDYDGQKGFLDQLCSVARDTGVHIHLAHHSRKGKDEYEPPRKHDMKGSGSIIDQVDNLIIVWKNKRKEERIQAGDADMSLRHEPDALLIVDKQRNGEWEGKIKLWFDAFGRGLKENGIG
jgi:twinkle protein